MLYYICDAVSNENNKGSKISGQTAYRLQMVHPSDA